MNRFVQSAPHSREFGQRRKYAVVMSAERLLVNVTDSVPVRVCGWSRSTAC
jgi:hypothetical protein